MFFRALSSFKEESNYLLDLDTRDVLGSGIVETVNNIEKIGKEQYESFIKERFVERSVSLSKPITIYKNSLFICSS